MENVQKTAYAMDEGRRQQARRSKASVFAAFGAAGLMALLKSAPAAAQEPAQPAPSADQAQPEGRNRTMQPEAPAAAEQPQSAPPPAAAPQPEAEQPKAQASVKVDLSTITGSFTSSTGNILERLSAYAYGMQAPDFRRTLIRPLLPTEGATIVQSPSAGLSSHVNNRALAVGDFNLSVSSPFTAAMLPGGDVFMLYGKGGVEMYALRARSKGTYESSSTRLEWPVDSKGIFNGGEGSAYRGNIELHGLFLVMPTLSDVASAAQSVDPSKPADAMAALGNLSPSAWDVSLRFGAGHSSMDMRLPYSMGGGVQDAAISGGAWSFDIGAELAHPVYIGSPSAVRFEAAGASYTLGNEIVNAYAAFSGNFTDSVRLLLVPRFLDIKGEMGPQGELKLEGTPINWLTLGVGFVGGYTFKPEGKDNTGLLAGYGEATFGGGSHALKRASATLRAGYAAEVGGDEFSRLPASPFIWLGMSAPLGK